MSSLRRDLLERRLWPLAVILIAAIVAVPFLLAGHGHQAHAALADSAGPVPAAPATASGSATTSGSSSSAGTNRSHHASGAASSSSRDPFAGTATATTSTTSTTATPSVSSAASSAAASQTSTPVSAPATGGASSFRAPPPSTPATSTPTTSTPSTRSTSSTPTTSKRTPTTSTTPVAVSHHGASAGEKWSLYGVDVRVKAPDGTASVLTDLARLTPLPAATWPKVMYMGTTNGGRDAVFALGDGVSARGPARCRPARDNCSLIVLAPRHAERISWTVGVARRRTLRLTVTRITTQVTHVRDRATAAIARHSAVGLCELQLGDPIQFLYDTSNGVLASASKSACTKSMKKTAAAFPGTASEAGQ